MYSPHALIMCGLYGYKDEQKPVISEAGAYAQYAEKLGINHDDIYLEERSQETFGNVLFAKMDILLPHKWSRILVIPSRNQLTAVPSGQPLDPNPKRNTTTSL